MADYIIDGTLLTAIADAIREKIESTEPITPEDMAEKVKTCFERGYVEGQEERDAEILSILSKTTETYTNEKITVLGSYIFSDNPKLQTATFPAVETVKDYAFQSCTVLHTLNLPNVKTIGTRVFVNTNSLWRLDLPVCTSLGNYCFHGGAKIDTLILRSETVCKAGTDIFGTGPIANKTGYIYVPDNLVEQYKIADGWLAYADQIKPISELEG